MEQTASFRSTAGFDESEGPVPEDLGGGWIGVEGKLVRAVGQFILALLLGQQGGKTPQDWDVFEGIGFPERVEDGFGPGALAGLPEVAHRGQRFRSRTFCCRRGRRGGKNSFGVVLGAELVEAKRDRQGLRAGKMCHGLVEPFPRNYRFLGEEACTSRIGRVAALPEAHLS